MKYTILVNTKDGLQVKKDLSQGKALRMYMVFKQQNVQCSILVQKEF